MADSEQTLGPPRGMRDFYPEDMQVRDAIFDAWTAAARTHGFLHYDACVVESLDLLKRKAGEEITNQLYCFQDKSGRDLALRAEMTPTLARMVAAKQGSLSLPIRWFTIAQCFRYERTTRGRKREHYQWNLDIIGEKSISAEVEVLSAATTALRSLGLGPDAIQIHYNSRTLLSDLLATLNVPSEHHAATFLALDKRGKITDEEIAELLRTQGLNDEQIRQVFTVVNLRSLDDVRSALGRETDSLRELIRFQELAQACQIDSFLRFDLSVIRGLAYYTGIVFEAFDAERSLRAIFGGGRYDRLLSDLGGTSVPGVGLGFGDVVIAELLEEKGKTAALRASQTNTVGVSFMEDGQQHAAISLATALRQSGRQIDLALAPERAKNFFSRCDRSGFKQAVFLGPDDITKGAYRLKELATRTERTLSLANPTEGL